MFLSSHADPKMWLTTDAIGNDGMLDPRYTCDLDNSSPELRWGSPPENTAGFALIAEDLDAPQGVLTHWVIYHIPAEVRHLPAGIPAQEALPNGIRQGINSFGKLGYAGPCPPYGDRPHRYRFLLLALKEMPPTISRAHREQIQPLIDPLVLAQAETLGLYQRHIQRAG